MSVCKNIPSQIKLSTAHHNINTEPFAIPEQTDGRNFVAKSAHKTIKIVLTKLIAIYE